MTAAPITRVLSTSELPKFLEGKVKIGTEVGYGYRFLGLAKLLDSDKEPQVVVGAVIRGNIDLFYHYSNMQEQVYHCTIGLNNPDYAKYKQILDNASQS